MRVNIMGKGVCPVIGSILPLVNVEVSEGTIAALVNTRSIRVFDSITGIQITSRNYKNIIMSRNVTPSAQVETPIEPVIVSPNQKTAKKKSTKKAVQEVPAKVEAVPEAPVEETAPETVEVPTTETEPVVEQQPELQPETSEPEPVAEVNDTTEDTTTDSSAETESEAPAETTYSSKKKKKR